MHPHAYALQSDASRFLCPCAKCVDNKMLTLATIKKHRKLYGLSPTHVVPMVAGIGQVPELAWPTKSWLPTTIPQFGLQPPRMHLPLIGAPQALAPLPIEAPGHHCEEVVSIIFLYSPT